MGLISPFVTRSGIKLPAAYHRVQKPITVEGGTVTAVVATYATVEAYTTGRAVVDARAVQAPFDPEVPVHQTIYAAVKELAAFADAVDHTEPLKVSSPELSSNRAAEMRARDIPPWNTLFHQQPPSMADE